MSHPPIGRPDIGDGTHPPTADELRHPLLRAEADAVAASATARFYRHWPELVARYGERGRQHTLADQFWHLGALDTALTLDAPESFVAYVDWLRTFLAGRGMDDVFPWANLTFFYEHFQALAPSPERERVLSLLDRALRGFPDAARVLPKP